MNEAEYLMKNYELWRSYHMKNYGVLGGCYPPRP